MSTIELANIISDCLSLGMDVDTVVNINIGFSLEMAVDIAIGITPLNTT